MKFLHNVTTPLLGFPQHRADIAYNRVKYLEIGCEHAAIPK
jgi:hypothetical protein